MKNFVNSFLDISQESEKTFLKGIGKIQFSEVATSLIRF